MKDKYRLTVEEIEKMLKSKDIQHPETLSFYQSYVLQAGEGALKINAWQKVLKLTMVKVFEKVITEGFVFTDPSNCGDLYVCESKRQGSAAVFTSEGLIPLDNECTDGKIFRFKYDGKIIGFSKYLNFKVWRNTDKIGYAGSSGLFKWIFKLCSEGKKFRAIKEEIDYNVKLNLK